MIFRHPILFWKYTIRKKSEHFLINGTSRDFKTQGLILGKNVRFGNDTRIGFFGGEDNKLIIGDNCYFVNRNSFLVGGGMEIGNNCLFASDILVTSENHSIDPNLDRPYEKLVMEPVKIGDSCWIGEKVVILPGVNIGEHSVIGAASVVTKDIPPYSIAVGNPARVIRKLERDS